MVSYFPCTSTIVSLTAWMVRMDLSSGRPPFPRTARAMSSLASSRVAFRAGADATGV
jgi:hypothetical protein